MDKSWCHWSAWILMAFVSITAGCSNHTVHDAEVMEEPLVIESYFKGKTRAFGVVLDRQGVVSRQFTVDLNGTWDDLQKKLTLDERFIFHDGERSRRVWHITRTAPGRYVGEADDVLGPAKGEVKGNTLHWQYTLLLPYRGQTIEVDFDDWMFLSDGVLLNRATMRKFGVKVGEVMISFRRLNE